MTIILHLQRLFVTQGQCGVDPDRAKRRECNRQQVTSQYRLFRVDQILSNGVRVVIGTDILKSSILIYDGTEFCFTLA